VFRNKNVLLTSIACWLGNLSVFFTAYYSFRLIYLTFLNNANFSRIQLIKESSVLLLLPLIILCIGSIFFGYVFKDFFIGFGTDIWNTSLFNHPFNLYFLESEFLTLHLKWLPFYLSLLGIVSTSILNLHLLQFKHVNFLQYLFKTLFFISKKWYFDVLYNKLIVFPILKFGYIVSFKNLDRGFIELCGPFGFSFIIPKLSLTFSKFQTGQITHYIFFMILSISLLLNNFVQVSSDFVLFFFILIFFL
jgi:NADH-ubiquinone oxidoreductase chain 5